MLRRPHIRVGWLVHQSIGLVVISPCSRIEVSTAHSRSRPQRVLLSVRRPEQNRPIAID